MGVLGGAGGGGAPLKKGLNSARGWGEVVGWGSRCRCCVSAEPDVPVFERTSSAGRDVLSGDDDLKVAEK